MMQNIELKVENMFEYVKKYIKRGIPIFPCREKDEYDSNGNIYKCKSPRTPKGVYDATTDLFKNEIRWIVHKNSGIGMPTGATSGFTVVDLDVNHGNNDNGIVEWEQLNKKYNTNPYDTTIIKTPRGGLHLYYQYNSQVKNSSNKIGKGIETKNNGHYVILPPSKIQTGEYKFVNKLKPNKIPEWIVTLLTPQIVKKNISSSSNILTEDEIIKLLDKIEPDCSYNDWITIGMALKNWNETIGFSLWVDWTLKFKNSDHSHRAKLYQLKWDSFRTTSNQITIGSLIYLSKQRK